MRTHLKNSVKTVAVLAAFSSALAVTLPAHAINAQKEKVSVTIDARDLATDRGIEQVYRTLASKAEASCETRGIKPIQQRVQEGVCTRRLLKEFVTDINNAKLTAYHQVQENSA